MKGLAQIRLVSSPRVDPDDPALPRGLALPRPPRSPTRAELVRIFWVASAILEREGRKMFCATVFGAGDAARGAARALERYALLLEAIDQASRRGGLVHIRSEGVAITAQAVAELRRFAGFVRWKRGVVATYVRLIQRERAMAGREASTKRIGLYRTRIGS